MKFILIILSYFFAFNINAQTNSTRIDISKRLERCVDVMGDPVVNCFITTDANGEQVYIDSATMAGMFGGSSSDLLVSIEPNKITSTQNNYSPDAIGIANYIYLSSNNIWAITGIVDSVAGVLEKTLINKGDSTIVFYMDHPDSDAAHRFTGYGSDFKLYPGMSCKILYDNTNRWRILGVEGENKNGSSYEMKNAGSSTSGDIYFMTYITLGTGGVSAVASTTTLPSGYRLHNNASSSGGGGISFSKITNTFTSFGSAHIYVEATVSLPDLSDVTNTFTTGIQLTNTPTSGSIDPNNTIGIRYSNTINSGEWELFSKDNTGVESTDDLDVVVVEDNIIKLGIWLNKSLTEARAYINGEYSGRVISNMPNAVVLGARAIFLSSAGTSVRQLNVHTFSSGTIYQ